MEQQPNNDTINDFFTLCSLRIKGYKNLKDITIDFSKREKLTLLIGKNGCGKSNILEAIASIFAGLYQNNIHKSQFDYEIKFQKNHHNIVISLSNSDCTISIDGKCITKKVFLSKKDDYLPKNIIACYSGETTRLFDSYFCKYYEKYINTVKKQDEIPELPLLYINKYCWEIALITLYFHNFEDFTDIADFCTDFLNIKCIEKVNLEFSLKKIKEWKNNSVLDMVKHLYNIDNLSELTEPKLSLTLDEIKTRLSYMSEKQFFQTLYAATMPKKNKIITNIDLKCKLNNTDKSEITVDSLSEGNKKNLLMKLILEVIGDENSLFLFDEPDSHIHVSSKVMLKKMLDKFKNRENIITTHSPTLVSCFDIKHIQGIGIDKEGNSIVIDKDKTELISEITGGLWNIHEQNSFITSNKKLTLLVEGKTDKTHIENAFKSLKNDYPNLDFDIFNMNSETFIRDTIIGLSNSEINWNKKFIGIFDNDKASNLTINKNFKDKDNKGFYSVNCSDSSSNSFFAILLPKNEGHTTNNNFTIENYYNAEIYEKAYLKAVENRKGQFANCSIDDISNNIKCSSKTILAEMSNSLDANYFDKFKPLFDLINKINNLND